VIAEIANGTSCSRSSRFCAVTMMSSVRELSSSCALALSSGKTIAAAQTPLSHNFDRSEQAFFDARRSQIIYPPPLSI
jgi:hypothetical protein